MTTKKFTLTALVIAAIVTASFSSIFAGNTDQTDLKCYDSSIYKMADDSTGGNGEDGGIIIPPTGK